MYVSIVTDEPIWAEGIRVALRDVTHEIGFRVVVAVPEAWAGRLAEAGPADIVILEWTPGTLLDVIYSVRKALPDAKVVLWGRSVPVEFAWQATQAGVRGILRKGATMQTLLQCLDVVAANGTWFDNDLMSGFVEARTVTLTPRETQLVSLLAHGLKNKEIATALDLSEGTVKVYMSKLFEKLRVKDRFELALYGLNQLPASAPPTRGSLLLHQSAAGPGPDTRRPSMQP
jgi:DNA-binding NarL/FixJ family response regulator